MRYSMIFLATGVMMAASLEPTPAERAIAMAQQAIAKDAKHAEGHAHLALAYSRRARETADNKYYDEAEKAVQKSLELAPDNFTALKARAWALLGKHEFVQARDLAEKLNKRMPDDLQVYGFLTDAYVELGQYDEAEKACNWMLRLRPGNIPALTRAAYLRELFGDLEGALDLMSRAYQATPMNETEDRAWIMTQVAHLTLVRGDAALAEKMLKEALVLFPGYHYALAAMGHVKIAQKEYAAAAELFRQRYAGAPHPENLYDYADALAQAGKTIEAKKAFAEFETKALAESQNWDNSNRELVFYYANHAKRPKDALKIASLEYARRQDVLTRDAYAWALYMNGRGKEAVQQYEAVKAVGLKDPKVLGRAAKVTPARVAN
jgi:tetratricopeptide (TPR) repeat protein